MDHTRSRWALRTLAVGVTLALAVGAMAAPALAGKKPGTDSRTAYFGTAPFGSAGEGDGVLTMSPGEVVAGGYVEFTATFQNLGGQTLTHPTFGIGTQIAFEADGVTQVLLPDGVTLVDATPSSGSCAYEAPDGAQCEVANIPGYGSASVTVVLSIGAAANSVKASWKIAEQVNDNGANRDTWFATGGWTLDNVCDNIASSKIPGGQSVKFDVGQCGYSQSSSANVSAFAYTSGTVKQQATGPNCRPGGGTTCFGDYTVVQVGAESFVQWTITWDVALLPSTFKFSKAGVLHFPDSGAPVKINEACATATSYDCYTFFGFIDNGAHLQMIFQTLENGSIKGYG